MASHMVLITGSKTPLVAAVLLLALVAPFPYFGGLIPPVHSATNSTITFAASGDIGSLTSTTSARILSRLGASGVGFFLGLGDFRDRKSTRLNSSHRTISYA